MNDASSVASAHPPTLRAFFEAAPVGAGRFVRAIAAKAAGVGDVMGLGRGQAAERLAPAVRNALYAALDITLADLMARAWTDLAELRDAAQLSASGRPYLVALGRHRLVSEHAPGVEVAFGRSSAARFSARVSVVFTVEAMEIVIEDGAIASLRSGAYAAAGSLALEGVVLASAATRRFEIKTPARLRSPVRPPH